MFFRSTLIAHKTARKPYFIGLVVLKTLNLVLKEIIFLIQRNQEKPILQGLQRLWEVVRCAGISMECNTYATSMQQIYQ